MKAFPWGQYVGVEADQFMLAWWHCGEYDQSDGCFASFLSTHRWWPPAGSGAGGGGVVNSSAVIDWKSHQWGMCLFTDEASQSSQYKEVSK